MNTKLKKRALKYFYSQLSKVFIYNDDTLDDCSKKVAEKYDAYFSNIHIEKAYFKSENFNEFSNIYYSII